MLISYAQAIFLPFHVPLVPSLKGKAKWGACLLTIFICALFSGCATTYKLPSPKPLRDQDIRAILSRFEEQEKNVSSFYSLGGLLSDDWGSESKFLVVGIRKPLKIKIEITHPWGRPIFHILIDRSRLGVLSFLDKTLYLGELSPKILSKFFPADLDVHLIWAALRGYPRLLRYHRTLSRKSNQISLMNKMEKEVEIIKVYPETLLPMLVSLPERQINFRFLDFHQVNGIYYARKVSVENNEGKTNLVLETRKIFFNRSIPKQIFRLEKPPSFKVSYLDGNSNRAPP